MDLIIKNGKIVNHDGEREADIFIKDGIITKISSHNQVLDPNIKTMDASGKLIIPGGIDPHVHMHLPTPAGFSTDDFYSGSRAALIGGTTTLVDFVTPHRGQSLVEALKLRKAEAQSSASHTRFHVSPVEWRPSTKDEILECIHRYDVKSFKCYMAYKNNIGLSDDDLFEVMKVAGEAGALVTLHCEDGDAIEVLRDEYAKSDLPQLERHLRSRPPKMESRAVAKAIALAKKADCPIYIVHVSSRKSLKLIVAAQNGDQKVFAETCPQYLLLDQSKYSNDFITGAAFVMSPPLRSPQDNVALWAGLAANTISTIGTDHCPFNLEQKLQGIDDFRKIPNGAGGVEHRLALLYTYGVLQNKISLNQFVELTSTNAAKIFGMFPARGIITEGSQADLVIWNPDTESIIDVRTHHQNCDLNIYQGIPVKGNAEVVILAGNIVFE